MNAIKAVILLDVDGVLNPLVSMQKLVVDRSRAALIAQLSSLGAVVWATSWSVVHTHHLSQDLGLPADTAAIPFPPNLHVDPRNPAPTPKLHWVARWVNRNLSQEGAPATAVIWIDDQLNEDATEWARHEVRPTLLIRPDPATGLSEAHLAEVREFLLSLVEVEGELARLN
jgi:hypothetical protein